MFAALMIGITFAVVIGFTVQPLFTYRGKEGDVSPLDKSALQLRKQSILEQIKELEMEHDMGTVSASDFQRNRIELKREASNIMDQLESMGVDRAGG